MSLKDGLNEFRKDNKMFKLEFENNNEIIRRYDEVISEKSSKQALYKA